MKPICLSLFSLSILLPGVALAQSGSDADAATTPIYDVELVVFKNVKAPTSREFILPVSSPGKPERVLDLSSTPSVLAARELGYKILSDADYRLVDVAARLVASPRYELLLHLAWRQPGVELAQALPVWLRGGRVYGSEYISIDNQISLPAGQVRIAGEEQGSGKSFAFDEQTLEAMELQQQAQQSRRSQDVLYEFEGKITVTLSRYLHAYTDLVFRRPRASADQVPNNAPQGQNLASYAADTRILNNYLLREHRRMRSKNLHYLDNPEFGLLILITPYDASAEAAATAIETTPATSE